jgi:hypothetical protein
VINRQGRSFDESIPAFGNQAVFSALPIAVREGTADWNGGPYQPSAAQCMECWRRRWLSLEGEVLTRMGAAVARRVV